MRSIQILRQVSPKMSLSFLFANGLGGVLQVGGCREDAGRVQHVRRDAAAAPGLIETEDQYRLVYSLINRHILTGDNTRYSTADAIASTT